MTTTHECACGRGNLIEPGFSECFRCRVLGVGFTFRGSAIVGHAGFHRTAREFKEEHFGTSDDRELAKRGIVRASNYETTVESP